MAVIRVTHEELVSLASKACPAALKILSATKFDFTERVVQRPGKGKLTCTVLHVAFYDKSDYGTHVFADLDDTGGINLYRGKAGEILVPVVPEELFPDEGYSHIQAFVQPFKLATTRSDPKSYSEPNKSTVRQLRRDRLVISVKFAFVSTGFAQDVIQSASSSLSLPRELSGLCIFMQRNEARIAANESTTKDESAQNDKVYTKAQDSQEAGVPLDAGHSTNKRTKDSKRKATVLSDDEDYLPLAATRKRGPSDRKYSPPIDTGFKKEASSYSGTRSSSQRNHPQVRRPLRPSPDPLGEESSKPLKSSKGRERQTDSDDDGDDDDFYASMNKQIEERIQREVDNRLFSQDQKIRNAEKAAAAWKAKYELLKKKVDILKDDD